MIHEGFEQIFTGDAGQVTYLLIAGSVSLLFVMRTFHARAAAVGERLRIICFGVSLLAVSRVLLVYLLGQSFSWRIDAAQPDSPLGRRLLRSVHHHSGIHLYQCATDGVFLAAALYPDRSLRLLFALRLGISRG